MAGAPWSPYSLGLMAGALTNLGQPERAEPILATLRGYSYGGPLGLCFYCIVRGDIEEAVGWLEKGVEERVPASIGRVARAFESLFQRSARWPEVLMAMNLSPRH